MDIAMPEDSRATDVEKFLSEQKALEDRKQALIADLLKQKEATIKEFDEKLAKLGYQGDSRKSRRSLHKQTSKSSAEAAQLKGKAKP
jgi:hypothetical protein